MELSKTAKNAIAVAQTAVEETPAATLKHANSILAQYVTIRTMHAAKDVNLLLIHKYVDLPWTQRVIPLNIVPGIHRLVLLIKLLLMALLVEVMGFRALLELVLHEIFNVNKLSMGVRVLVTIRLVC